MLLRVSSLFSLFLGLISAFQDTSPFFLYSTSQIFQGENALLASATSISKSVESRLSECPSDSYILVSQPGATAEGYTNADPVPHMKAKLSGSEQNIRSTVIIDAVIGEVDVGSMSKMLQEKCGATHVKIDASTGFFAIDDERRPRVITLEFPPLPAGESRRSKLLEHDAFLASVIDYLPGPDYTVIYSTSPSSSSHHSVAAEPETYEMDTHFGAPVHMELRRDLSSHRRGSSNITLPHGALFERYSFFSPGIFMGFLVSLVLFSILYVAISAVSSLQVSYAAFDKEMGPAAQKKQQQ